jgi:hypothetical protein
VGWAQINVFSGHVRTLAIKDLLFHDGASGTMQGFSARRYSGILEIQHAGVATVPSFVWEAGGYTYVLMGPPSESSTPVVSLVKAIASFPLRAGWVPGAVFRAHAARQRKSALMYRPFR